MAETKPDPVVDPNPKSVGKVGGIMDYAQKFGKNTTGTIIIGALLLFAYEYGPEFFGRLRGVATAPRTVNSAITLDDKTLQTIGSMLAQPREVNHTHFIRMPDERWDELMKALATGGASDGPAPVINVEPADVTIQPADIVVQPAEVMVAPPQISVTPEFIVEPAAVTVQPPNIVVQPAEVTMTPEFNVQPAAVTVAPPDINVEPAAVVMQPANIVVEPAAVTVQPPNVIIEPGAVQVSGATFPDSMELIQVRRPSPRPNAIFLTDIYGDDLRFDSNTETILMSHSETGDPTVAFVLKSGSLVKVQVIVDDEDALWEAMDSVADDQIIDLRIDADDPRIRPRPGSEPDPAPEPEGS